MRIIELSPNKAKDGEETEHVHPYHTRIETLEEAHQTPVWVLVVTVCVTEPLDGRDAETNKSQEIGNMNPKFQLNYT